MAKSKPKKSFLSTPSARRATREEVDGEEPENYFYPRPPRGGRPQDPESMTRWLCISIHALREEGDRYDMSNFAAAIKISIHALREEGDHEAVTKQRAAYVFLSTPSARRATYID